jgi:iron(III) transport system permease protein
VGIFSIICLLPIISMVGSSLTVDGSLSCASHIKVYSDSRQALLFIRSITLAGGAALLSLVVGLPLAILIAKTDLPGKKIFNYLYLFPLLIPPYIHALTWIHLLGENGILTQYIVKLFNLNAPMFNIYGPVGVLFVLFISYYPFVTLLCLSGLRSTDGSLEEASLIIHRWRTTLRKVSIPISIPFIMSGALFVFVFSLSDYGVPDLLRVKTYPVEIFVQFSAFYDSGTAAATAIPLVLITLLLVLYQKKLMGERSYVTLGTSSRKGLTMGLGGWKLPAVIGVSFVILISVVIPLLDLIMQAGDIAVFGKTLALSWKEILFTSLLAAGSSLVMVMLSFILSYYIERSRDRARHIIDFLTVAPFAVPATVYGIGLIAIWNKQGLEWIYGTLIILLFACVARFIPFTVRVVLSSIKQVHPHIIEASYISTGSWFKSMRTVVGPLCLPGIIAAAYIAYVLCLGELGATLMVIPAGQTTLSMRIYTLMHYGASQMVASLCLILIGTAFLPFPFLLLWIKRYAKINKR